ncbi:hypothetical protein AAFN85_18965 [Mucilaginibacter sp. CAU 1740]
MDNRKFSMLIQAMNILSIVILEKHWKHGVKFSFKRRQPVKQ